ncbi:MAG: BamA/TamA family outer membrane protein, partial [Planctomycetota bacterium]
GSDFEYEAFGFDLRQFFPLATDHVLGVQAKAKYMRGDPPFYALAWIGGPWTLRGLYEGRFRDKTMAVIQAESRFMIRPRFGGVVFIGVGEVAEKYSDFSAENLRLAGGVGIRFTLDPKDRINLRIDVGVSEFGVAPVLLLTEAF